MIPFWLQRPPAQLRVLLLGAHSDDIEIGAGGTLLRLIAELPAVAVRWVVLSSTEARATEARRSAAAFLTGAHAVEVAVERFRENFFPWIGAEIKEYFERLKAAFEPDVVLTHAREDRHQDHRVVSDLTWNAFRDHLILEYEIPKYDGDLGAPNLFVPLSETLARRKVELLLQHFASQRERHWFDEATFLGLMRVRGVETGGVERFAEAFHCRKLILQPTAG